MNKKYFTELILITCTNDGNNIKNWINWHESLGFEHIIIIDNDSTCDIKKIIADLNYKNIDYIKITGSISQEDIYNFYVNNSNSFWVLPLDDDEYLYINQNINDLLISAYNKYKSFKFSFPWAMMYSNELLKNTDKSYLEAFQYVDINNKNINIKTIVNTLIKHYYGAGEKHSEMNKTVEEIEYDKINAWNNYENITIDRIGTVHNPLSKYNNTYFHSYNINNINDPILCCGFYSNSILKLDTNFILHFKYRTIDDWNYKLNIRNKFNSCKWYYKLNNCDEIYNAYKTVKLKKLELKKYV